MRISIFLIIISFLLCVTGELSGQYDHVSIYPDLNDNDLSQALLSDYKPNNVLDLTEARDTLYKRVYLNRDSVSCIYTRLTKYLDPLLDPSQALFEGGGNADINLEHSYPRSKGASQGNANSDMHHLFPSRVTVNSDRASIPYQEIPDNQTQKWYYLDQTITNQPNNNKDAYSEFGQGGFEPREDAKGNIARAYFYFYTMYQQEALSADPDFFDGQVNTLCDWHAADPVDQLEWERTFKIAEYQDDRPNPFVLDCRLSRLYCEEVSMGCRLVSTDDIEESSLSVKPTLIERDAGIAIQVEGLSDVARRQCIASFYNLQGQLISQQSTAKKLESPKRAGMYLLIVTQRQSLRYTGRVVVY